MSFFDELKRRNVVRVGLAYAVIGWALAQVAEFAVDTFGAPDWVLKIFVVFLMLGLPIALFLAWAFEMTPDGIKREKDVDRSESITPQTGRKLDFIIIGVLVLAVGILLVDEFVFDRSPATDEIVATERQSIAVLPFTNMSDDSDHFADGLSEELLNLLAKNPDLRVIGRTSSFAFKGRNEDLRGIGDALGVDHVLEGSVRRSGDQLRVTAQLIDVADGSHLWSETYDRLMADIFAIQDDVAAAITGELELRLVPDSGRPTENAQAYALYVEALTYIANNDDPNMMEIVVDLLDRAIELDPLFAIAHQAKATAYWSVSGERLSIEESLRLTGESAKRALELDESLTLARYYVAVTDNNMSSWDAEFIAAESAFSADPANFNILRVWCADLINAVYFREALECVDRMIAAEPLSPVSHWRAALTYGALGRREEAHESFLRGAAGGSSVYVWELVLEATINGDFDQALEYAVDAPDEYGWQPDDIRQVQQLIAAADDAAITDWIEQKTAEADDFHQRNRMYSWYLALGHIDQYWASIDRVLPDPGNSWGDVGFLFEYGYAYPEKGMLRHPAFITYAEESGLVDLWDRRGAPDTCSKIGGEWTCE